MTQLMAEAQSISVTPGVLTDNSDNWFMALTSHFTSNDWVLNSFVPACCRAVGRHIAAALSNFSPKRRENLGYWRNSS